MKPNHRGLNNIPKITINRNENENNSDNNEKTDRSNITKSLNTFSPVLSSNTNIKTNVNQNMLLNNKNNDEDENNTSSNRITKNEENKEDEGGNDVNSRIRRKSRNYIEKIEKLVGDRNRHTVKAVISLNIPSDVTRERSSTQKQFDKLVAQFRTKQSKYRKEEQKDKDKDKDKNKEKNDDVEMNIK